MRVFKIEDDSYTTWIAAINAQEALDYYNENFDDGLSLKVEDMKELSDIEMSTKKIATDAYDNSTSLKSFADILAENEDPEDSSAWCIAINE